VSKNHVTKRPHFGSRKGEHDVTEHSEEDDVILHVTNVPLEAGVDEKYLVGSYRCKNVTGMNCRIH
jgi:hypothetical protein